MIVIKSCILLLILIISFFIGKLIAQKYINREKELKELKTALTMFETKMKFTYEAIPEIFMDISEKTEGNIGKIFKKAVIQMEETTAGDAWNIAIEECTSNMTAEDKNILKNLGRLLGQTDIDGQIAEIELVNNFLGDQIELAKKERAKNEKMYKTLGGVIGLALVIILI